MRRSEDRIGLKSAWLRTVIPYSVSIPITFGMAILPSRRSASPVPAGALRRLGGDAADRKGVRGRARSLTPAAYRYWPVV